MGFDWRVEDGCLKIRQFQGTRMGPRFNRSLGGLVSELQIHKERIILGEIEGWVLRFFKLFVSFIVIFMSSYAFPMSCPGTINWLSHLRQNEEMPEEAIEAPTVAPDIFLKDLIYLQKVLASFSSPTSIDTGLFERLRIALSDPNNLELAKGEIDPEIFEKWVRKISNPTESLIAVANLVLERDLDKTTDTVNSPGKDKIFMTDKAVRDRDAFARSGYQFLAIDRALDRLRMNWRHPGLRSHLLKDVYGPAKQSVYSSYVTNYGSGGLRILWIIDHNRIVVLRIVDHSEYDRLSSTGYNLANIRIDAPVQ